MQGQKRNVNATSYQFIYLESHISIYNPGEVYKGDEVGKIF